MPVTTQRSSSASLAKAKIRAVRQGKSRVREGRGVIGWGDLETAETPECEEQRNAVRYLGRSCIQGEISGKYQACDGRLGYKQDVHLARTKFMTDSSSIQERLKTANHYIAQNKPLYLRHRLKLCRRFTYLDCLLISKVGTLRLSLYMGSANLISPRQPNMSPCTSCSGSGISGQGACGICQGSGKEPGSK